MARVRLSRNNPEQPSLRWSDVVLLGVAASFRPLSLMAAHMAGIVHPERIAALILTVWLVATLTALFLTRSGAERSVVVFVVFVSTVLFMTVGVVIGATNRTIGWSILLVLIASVALMVRTIPEHPLIRVVIVSLAALLASGPAISLYNSLRPGESNVESTSNVEIVGFNALPDIFLVVVDGYPGVRALDQDYENTKGGLIAELNSRDFQVPSSAWAAYWSTELSVSSLLEMAYPLVDNELNVSTEKQVYQMIGGNNNLVEILIANGYETLMVESGWSGSACGPAFDVCIPSVWLDEAMFVTLSLSAVGPIVSDAIGHAFTAGTKA